MKKKKMLYTDLLDIWIASHRLKIKESTAYNYEKAMPRVKEALGSEYVRNITAQMIHDFIYGIQGIKSVSTRLYCRVIQSSFRFALQQGYVHYNPCVDVVFPKNERAEVIPFTEAEINLLLSVNVPDWIRDGIIIAYRTGMRPGEIYALKWSDINLIDDYISVQRSITRASGRVKTTKTPAGVRRIDIDSDLVQYLQPKMREAESEYVFPGYNGFRVPWNIAAVIKDMCLKVGIAPRNFYALRHTHATMLLERGVHPKIVQERLGHRDIKVTMQVYSHITPTIQKDAVKAMNRIPLPNL